MQHRALLVGSATRGLEGVEHDLSSMAAILGEYGFSTDIRSGPTATRARILDGIETLIATCEADDAAVFYYSGHGASVPNLGLITPDGEQRRRYYQLIVPTDFEQTRPGDFRGILDIELGRLLARLTATTRNTTIILDCCYAAGTMRAPLVPGITTRRKSFDKKLTGYYQSIRAHLAALTHDPGPAVDPLDPEHDLDAIVIAASAADQKAYEIQIGQAPATGILTHALVEALRAHRGMPISWDALYPYILAPVRIHHGDAQRPQISGPRHRQLFSLAERPAAGHALIERCGQTVYVHSGALMGMRAGDQLSIMPMTADRADPAQELARATVIDVAPERARVELTPRPAAAPIGPAARAFPLRRSNTPRAIGVHCSGELGAILTRLIAATELLEPRPAADTRGNGDGLLAVVAPVLDPAITDLVRIHDHSRTPLSAPMRASDQLITQLLRIQHAAIVRAMRSGTGPHALHVPMELDWSYVQNRELVTAADDHRILTEGDHIVLTLRHFDRARTLYWTALDVDTDSSVKLLNRAHPAGIPCLAREPCFIGYRPGDRMRGIPIRWPPALPRDVHNLRTVLSIVSDQPCDLRAIETHGLHRHAAGLATSVLHYATPPSTRSPTGSRPPLCYAVQRVDFHVRPARNMPAETEQ